MNTFLPYESFSESAACLDNKRLGKQRVEAWQIYCALTQSEYGWKNHPAVKMWKGYEPALLAYGEKICDEWVARGCKDTMRERFISSFDILTIVHSIPVVFPTWLTDSFCEAHRSNLLRKDPTWYSQFNWNVPDNLPYIWPIK